ncbi:MAG: MauE/DoxX family redox-associated membrane protein [Acidobacteriota bacterium]|nr:MauE/DoxX family redox-associated membrane protein [Acidobacteriota bacterium]
MTNVFFWYLKSVVIGDLMIPSSTEEKNASIVIQGIFFKLKNCSFLIVAFLLSGIFLAAGISKVVTFNEFLALLKNYEIFPDIILPYLALGLISIEITTGVCLLIPQLRSKAALCAIGLLTVFLFLIMYTQIYSLDIPCGCFAFLKNKKMNLSLAIQDLVLLFLTILLYRSELVKRS